MEFLNPEVLPRYLESSYRSFLPGELHVDRRTEYHVLLLLLGGTLIFSEDGARHEISTGEWYIQQAGKEQRGGSASLSPHYFYIHFQGEISKGEGIPLQGRFSPERLHDAIRRLDLAEKNQLSLLEHTRWFYEILTRLQEEQPACPIVFEMQTYIAAHYTEALGVRELAERFSYSPDHVIRLFKRHLGITPHQYIARVRLNQAKRMLTTTNRTLQLIAAQTGFSDSTVLFRAFIRETGLSPSMWRKSRLGE